MWPVFSTWACFNAGLAFKTEIFLICRYSCGKQAKASTKKQTIWLSGITWAGKTLQLQDWWKRESAEHLMMFALPSNINVLSKSSSNIKCSILVLCCCKNKIPLLQRCKSQDGSPSACFLATKIKIFCSFELLWIIHSFTWDSHKAVMWFMGQPTEQFQR